MLMRNNESFAGLPDIDISRSKFDRDSNLHTTLNSGQLIPIFCDEVLAGDTFDITCASSVRMTTPIVPVIGNCYLDTFFFFVPSRLCWNRFKEFFGESPRANWDEINDDIKLPHIAFNKQSQWIWDADIGRYRKPSIEEMTNGLFVDLENTLVDYFGLPYLNMRDERSAQDIARRDYSKTDTFNMLPFEAYNLIWNEFFRDQNIMEKTPLFLQETSSTDEQALSGVYLETNSLLAGSTGLGSYDDFDITRIISQYLTVKPVSKFHDYFTSSLPQPQKHAPIAIPGFESPLEVRTQSIAHDIAGENGTFVPLQWRTSNGQEAPTGVFANFSATGTALMPNSGEESIGSFVLPTNLYALFGGSAPNINDLRYAFALQNLFEQDARGGTRFIELLHTHFGVTSPDARLQRPEYLGGDRILINMEQVVQTSETTASSPQGNVAGLSLTNNIGNSFVKSFTEPGYIIGLACVRPQHSYQNGIGRMWSRQERFDFYYPALAHIGEQPVFLRELLAGVHTTTDDGVPTVFGYQEPWAEYRYKPSSVTGKMRSLLPDSLDIWHYADIFNNVDDQDNELGIFDAPTLSPEFIAENPFAVDRTLAISYREQPQFYGDFYFDCKCTRPMPLYSIPGLVDHH